MDCSDDTLVIWGGEFGRTPVSEAGDGRDHNPYGFTMWMAGGGVRGGLAYGATDDFGFQATENRMSIHDLHATILNQLGLDHERLTYRYAGRDFRLTDVQGRVVRGDSGVSWPKGYVARDTRPAASRLLSLTLLDSSGRSRLLAPSIERRVSMRQPEGRATV